MIKKSIYLIFTIVLIQSCTSVNKKKSSNKNYAFSLDSAKVSWVSYKTSENIPVTGTFKKYKINSSNKKGNLNTILKDATFLISGKSVYTENEERDKKISTSFFKKMLTDSIYGNVVKVQDSAIEIKLSLNKIEENVKMNVKYKEKGVEVSGKIKLSLWNSLEMLAQLNKVCEDLHKSSDGKSVLSENVLLKLYIPFSE